MQGLERIGNELPELKLDVPNAYVHMENFSQIAAEMHFIPKSLLEDLPSGLVLCTVLFLFDIMLELNDFDSIRYFDRL